MILGDFGKSSNGSFSAATGYFSTKPAPFERARRVEKLLLLVKTAWAKSGGARFWRKSLKIEKVEKSQKSFNLNLIRVAD